LLSSPGIKSPPLVIRPHPHPQSFGVIFRGIVVSQSVKGNAIKTQRDRWGQPRDSPYAPIACYNRLASILSVPSLGVFEFITEYQI
jgi:hypothetical protein